MFSKDIMFKFKTHSSNKYFFCFVITIFCLLIFFSFSQKTFAQSLIAEIPSLFDPGLMAKNVQSTLPSRPLTTSAAVTQTTQPSQKFPNGEKIKFQLNRIIFQGNTVISTHELMKEVSSSFNKTISLNDLQTLVDKITAKYRAEGYILSRAILPPQEIKHGIVKIQIVEGFITKVTIEGKTGNACWFLQQYGKRILASKPLKISVLEHELLLANDLPGLTVRAVLKPSTTIPGGADLTLVSEHKVANGYVTYDNFGTRYLGPLEIGMGGGLNSGVLPGDNNAVNFVVTSRGRELRYGEFVHTQPIGAQGLTLSLGTNYNQTEPGFLLDPLNIIGRSFSIYSNLNYPIIRSRSKNLYLTGALNYQNVTSTLLSFPYYQDRIRSIGLGGYFMTSDSWHGNDTIELLSEQGLEIFGAQRHFFQSRPKGTPGYSKVMLNASRLHTFSPRYSFLASVQSQYAFQALLASEQFSYGGPLFGRGYGPSEIVGDRGVGAKGEFRIDTAPDFKLIQTIQYFVFYDAGVIWNIDNVNLPIKLSATSAGLGARFNFIPQLSAEVYVARPLTRKATTLTPTDQNGYQARGFFQLVARI